MYSHWIISCFKCSTIYHWQNYSTFKVYVLFLMLKSLFFTKKQNTMHFSGFRKNERKICNIGRKKPKIQISNSTFGARKEERAIVLWIGRTSFLRHSFDSVNTIYTLQNYYYAQTSFIDIRQQWDGRILLVARMFSRSKWTFLNMIMMMVRMTYFSKGLVVIWKLSSPCNRWSKSM